MSTAHSAGRLGDHSQSLNIFLSPIVNKYREGKVKRTLDKGVKEILKWHTHNQSKQSIDKNLIILPVTMYLLHNGSASIVHQQA
jgi:hypothetical protein